MEKEKQKAFPERTIRGVEHLPKRKFQKSRVQEFE
jgi:hypothetical protein